MTNASYFVATVVSLCVIKLFAVFSFYFADLLSDVVTNRYSPST